MAICEELALEEAVDLSQEKPRNERRNAWMHEWMKEMSRLTLCDNGNSDMTTEY